MPGGFVRPLGKRASDEVARRWPALDWTRVDSDWAQFQVRLQSPATGPKEIRQALDRVVHLSTELRVCLDTLPEEAADYLWDFLHDARQPHLLAAMPGLLTFVQRAAMRGHNAEVGRDGRRLRGAKHQLFYSLREALRQAGYTGRRINGDVARLAEILFDDAELERPSDLSRAVREAFESGDDRSSSS